MKVINGDFGKKSAEELEELPLIEKLAMISADLVNDIDEKGNFILIVQKSDGSAHTATDMEIAECYLVMALMQKQILEGSVYSGVTH